MLILQASLSNATWIFCRTQAIVGSNARSTKSPSRTTLTQSILLFGPSPSVGMLHSRKAPAPHQGWTIIRSDHVRWRLRTRVETNWFGGLEDIAQPVIWPGVLERKPHAALGAHVRTATGNEAMAQVSRPPISEGRVSTGDQRLEFVSFFLPPQLVSDNFPWQLVNSRTLCRLRSGGNSQEPLCSSRAGGLLCRSPSARLRTCTGTKPMHE
jgi:hypothetical protein